MSIKLDIIYIYNIKTLVLDAIDCQLASDCLTIYCIHYNIRNKNDV